MLVFVFINYEIICDEQGIAKTCCRVVVFAIIIYRDVYIFDIPVGIVSSSTSILS